MNNISWYEDGRDTVVQVYAAFRLETDVALNWQCRTYRGVRLLLQQIVDPI